MLEYVWVQCWQFAFQHRQCSGTFFFLCSTESNECHYRSSPAVGCPPASKRASTNPSPKDQNQPTLPLSLFQSMKQMTFTSFLEQGTIFPQLVTRCSAKLKALNRRNTRRKYPRVSETRRFEGNFPSNDRMRRRSYAYSKYKHLLFDWSHIPSSIWKESAFHLKVRVLQCRTARHGLSPPLRKKLS